MFLSKRVAIFCSSCLLLQLNMEIVHLMKRILWWRKTVFGNICYSLAHLFFVSWKIGTYVTVLHIYSLWVGKLLFVVCVVACNLNDLILVLCVVCSVWVCLSSHLSCRFAASHCVSAVINFSHSKRGEQLLHVSFFPVIFVSLTAHSSAAI